LWADRADFPPAAFVTAEHVAYQHSDHDEAHRRHEIASDGLAAKVDIERPSTRAVEALWERYGGGVRFRPIHLDGERKTGEPVNVNVNVSVSYAAFARIRSIDLGRDFPSRAEELLYVIFVRVTTHELLLIRLAMARRATRRSKLPLPSDNYSDYYRTFAKLQVDKKEVKGEIVKAIDRLERIWHDLLASTAGEREEVRRAVSESLLLLNQLRTVTAEPKGAVEGYAVISDSRGTFLVERRAGRSGLRAPEAVFERIVAGLASHAGGLSFQELLDLIESSESSEPKEYHLRVALRLLGSKGLVGTSGSKYFGLRYKPLARPAEFKKGAKELWERLRLDVKRRSEAS
jgi:hypothetical protein